MAPRRSSIAGMKRGVAVIAVVLVLLTGCARHADSLAQMGCETVDTYLPKLDSSEQLDSEALSQLSEQVTEELRLGYFDDETAGLFRLLIEPVQDSVGAGYTPADVDYQDIRARIVSHCASVGWELDNA